MLTKVILDGQLGKQFGRLWELDVATPREALALINANKPGVHVWIRKHLSQYGRYRVFCTYEDGRSEELDNDTYALERKVISIRFTPLVEGASGGVRFVAGAILVAASFIPGMQAFTPYMMSMGISLMVGGAIEMLTGKPSAKEQQQQGNNASYYFNGAADTTGQGMPVQLIFGRVLAGASAVSVALTVNEYPLV